MAERNEPRLAACISASLTVQASAANDVITPEAARVWLDALGDDPVWAVEAAFRDWVKAETFRPTPADILKRCPDYTRIPRQIIHNAAIRDRLFSQR